MRMRKGWICGVAALLIGASAAASDAAALSADESLARLVSGWSGSGEGPSDAELPGVREAIRSAASASPRDARWELGLALLALRDNDAKTARTHAERAVELDPSSADAQVALGDAIFRGINDAGLLEKGSLASKGRKAYERALELDPNHVSGAFGLGMFYAAAPGIAGGSKSKAQEMATRLLGVDGGAYLGRMLQVTIATSDEKWAEAVRALDAAEAAATTDQERAGALRTRASIQLTRMKDIEGALATSERLIALEGEDGYVGSYLAAEALRELGRCGDAIPRYRHVLAERADSANTRLSLAECLEQTGDTAGAAALYREFLEMFPKHDRAKEAKKALKRLG